MTRTLATVEINEVVEKFIREMIKLSENPRQVLTGIHNAFCHGDILEEIGLSFTDQQLTDIFNDIDEIGEILGQIQDDQ